MLFLFSTVFAADSPIERLLQASLASDEPMHELVELCDDIGPRLSGSSNLDRAIRWAKHHLQQDGVKVSLQPIEVRHWVRGFEEARILAPVAEPLVVLGLGGTVGTPTTTVEGRVLVVQSFEELERAGERVRGTIVLFDAPWNGYGETVPYRLFGADRAAALGAKAVLVRSVTDVAMGIPHTGVVLYREGPKIPALAITPEAAARLHRWSDRGRAVTVQLSVASEERDPVQSYNVVGEVVGKNPNEVVLLSCHLDSWDVGQGAQDDGASCVAVMEALAQIQALGVQPQRSVRAVLFTNEENGVAGGKGYVLANPEHHVALIESDTGMGGTLGFSIDAGLEHEEANRVASEKWIETVTGLLTPVADLGINQVTAGYAGTDIKPMLHAHGGLALGVKHDMSGYWAIHHTSADTIDKINPVHLRQEVAMLAVVAWQLANSKRTFGTTLHSPVP